MNYFVYILHSNEHDKFYIGQTNNVIERVERHNAGYVQPTKAYIPWSLVLSIPKETRSEAMALEKKLKNLNRQRLMQFISKYS